MKLFDSVGNELKPGDIVRVFHFINVYRRRKEFMYKQVGDYVKGEAMVRMLHLPINSDQDGYWATQKDFENSILVQRAKYEAGNLKRNNKLRD